jgi:predicted  nucleic acid-binding Zn-ribbon protein
MSDLQSPPRWPILVAAAAAVLWLVVSLMAMAPFFPGLALPADAELVAIAAGVALNFAAPLAVIWLVSLKLRDSAAVRAERAALMAEQAAFADLKLREGADALAALEARLSDFTGQLTAMAKPVERQHAALAISITALHAATDSLAQAAGRTEAATRQLGEEVPAATRSAEAFTAMLSGAQTLLTGEVTRAEGLMANLAARLAEARIEASATAQETESRIDAVAAASIAARAALEAPLAALDEGIDATLARTSEALDITRDGVQAQTNAILASIDQARTSIEHIGGEAASAIAARLAALVAGLTNLGSSLDEQAARAATLVDGLGTRFQTFDADLGTSTDRGNAMLASVADRLADVRAAIAGLGTPVAETEASLDGLSARLVSLDIGAGRLFGAMDERLPAAVPGLEDLANRLANLHDDATALANPIDAGAETMAQAHVRLQAAAATLDSSAQALADRLASAEASLASLTRSAEDEALAASASLLDSFSRIREIASQAAGTMRDTLSGVVAEAEAALNRAGTSRAEIAFGAPVRTAIAALEVQHANAASAAQVAAERVSARLLALTRTMADMETHFDKRQTEIDIRERSDLAKRAATLLATLHESAIDLSRLLALDIEDQDYEAWLAGDRSRFLRRLATGLDEETGRGIARHLAHDPAFRADATRFAEAFESLIEHVSTDRQGRPLAATLLASDPGKLYLALTQVVKGD